MFDRQVMRGFLANIEVVPPIIVVFQYNPTEITDNKGVVFQNDNKELGGEAPKKLAIRGDERVINFKFSLHGLEQGTDRLNPLPINNGISTELAKLRSFMYPASDSLTEAVSLLEEQGEHVKPPPTIIFGFGAKILECKIDDLNITETQFNSMLAPVRADVNIKLHVVEAVGNDLYEFDRLNRNALTLLGLQSISPV